ncbi:aminotransferase class V-fold PLP-dependent enzyme [Sphingobium boeckii]|uniref:Selenocysteine lyase/cysteine desulfurase n=1 Tax=Sphingobium boeckii TaxID=1082345 RepID=A0A7W9AG05_9SPHN|nr:aminotransferase class V-fold PLP-dependent enzyme [Sphingobium boeckii]MBB5684774.1 selenocysteine lyase/cysteine desulfurase [Sphingobium boeckii]
MNLDFDIAAFRSHFASLPRLTYLNSGSYGLLAGSVRTAFDSYLDGRVTRGADWGGWVGALEETRGHMAALLGVDADEMAITGSASAGINALASAFDFSGPRNKVVVTNFDFPTSAQIWHAQERVGAEVVHVPEAGDGFIPLEHFERVIDERTAIVVLSQLCYRHGGRIPDTDIQAIAKMAHDMGALVMLDSYQIVGTTPVLPRDLDVDFCVGGMLKYLLGTAGIGYLYVRRSLIDRLVPRTSGWFAQAEIDAMDIFANDPSPTARRFEGGTPPVANCIATVAGLKLVRDTGLQAISTQIKTVTRHTMESLREAGIACNNPDMDDHRGPLISIQTSDENALVSALAAQNIVTSRRDGRLRAGFHAYNDAADADTFVAALIDKRHLING